MPLHRSLMSALTLVAALAVGGCGTDDSSSDSSTKSGGMGDMDMSKLDEPDATPADKVDGDVKSGPLTLLDTAPPGSEDVAGQAWLAQSDDGTTVTIRLTGLQPDTEYLAHLHQQRCEQDNGGDHFRFDPDGKDVPPNEVHLGFVSTPDGTGGATVTNDRRVEDGAPALVVHPADAMDNRLACADFS